MCKGSLPASAVSASLPVTHFLEALTRSLPRHRPRKDPMDPGGCYTLSSVERCPGSVSEAFLVYFVHPLT